MTGGKMQINLPADAELAGNLLRVRLPNEGVYVSIMEDDRSAHNMRFFCSACEGVCEHIGAAFSLVLEEKTALGLASPPPENDEPLLLTDEELEHRELLRRSDRAKMERMRHASADPKKLWTDYTVTNRESGKSYRVALRGWERGESYCTCPDFRKNTLGTCKHIMFVSGKMKAAFPPKVRATPFRPQAVTVFVKYGRECELRVQVPLRTHPAIKHKLSRFVEKPVADVEGLTRAVSQCTANSADIVIYPDAEQYIGLELHRLKVRRLVEDIRRAPDKHPCGLRCLRASCCPTSSTASLLPWAPAARSLPTTWDLARPSRE